MKKRSKALIIGFIALWVLVFGVMWIKSIGKKGQQGKGLDSIKQMIANIGQKQGAKKPGPEGMAQEQKEQEAVPLRCYKVAPMDFPSITG